MTARVVSAKNPKKAKKKAAASASSSVRAKKVGKGKFQVKFRG